MAERGTHTRHVSIFVPTMRAGGAERIMATLASEFAKAGYRVDLVLVQAVGPFLEELDQRVDVVDLRATRTLRAFWPLVRYLRQARPEAMLSAMGHANVTAVFATLAARSKTRVVVSERTAPARGKGDGPISLQMKLAKQIAYRRAHGIIAVSDGVAEGLASLLHLPRERIRIVQNPVDLNRIASLAKEEPEHPWFELPDPIILAVGRLAPVKGYPMLLHAFAAVLEKRPAKLIVLGEGELRARLVGLARELGVWQHVDFAGFRSNPYAWMSRSDVYVLSSLSEGFPNSLLQAMACGARVVSTNCDYGPHELLAGGAWGRLVPPNDPVCMAEAIVAALDDPAPPDVRARASDFRVDSVVAAYASTLGLER